MKVLAFWLCLVAVSVFGYEQTFTNSSSVLIAAGPVVAVVPERPLTPTAITAGSVYSSGDIKIIARNSGTTEFKSTITTSTVPDQATLVITGPLGAGTYRKSEALVADVPVYTNTTYSLWNDGTLWKLSLAGKVGSPSATNYYWGTALVGVYAGHGGFVGAITSAYATVTSYTTNAMAVSADVTRDGTVEWLVCDGSRKHNRVQVLSGNVCLGLGRDKIYQGVGVVDVEDYSGNLTCLSTNSATIEVTVW